MSLAHNGVLFLDELPEFSYRVLEILRQPLEEGHIVVVRSAQTHVFPARFLLIAAMNPCPCGFRGDPKRACTCTRLQIRRYRSRLSGPLLDRIDLHVEVPPVEVRALEAGEGEPSESVARRVAAARNRARERIGSWEEQGIGIDGRSNGALGPADLRRLPQPEERARAVLARSTRAYGLTARTYHRILKVAWTIADLEGASIVRAEHVSEALHYRVGERDRIVASPDAA